MKLTAHNSAPDFMFKLVPVNPYEHPNKDAFPHFKDWELANPSYFTDDTDLTEGMEVDSEDYEKVEQVSNNNVDWYDLVLFDKSWFETMPTRTILRKKAEAVREKPSEPLIRFERDVFIEHFSKKEFTKIAKNRGHESIEDTNVTKSAKLELSGTCGRCSNCNGLECSLVYVPESLCPVSSIADSFDNIFMDDDDAPAIQPIAEESGKGWISVETELPKDWVYGSENVLCFNGNYIHIAYIKNSEWYFTNGEKLDVANGWDVTHWMPLPEPPTVQPT